MLFYMRLLTTALAILLCSTALMPQDKSPGAPVKSGPFGFEKGMTLDQITAAIGTKAIVKRDEPLVTVSTAPKPHSMFTSYVLIISPNDGLLKIMATSVDIATGVHGREVHTEFSKINGALREIYGAPTEGFDSLLPNSLWKGPQYWMMGLLKRDRKLVSFWNLNNDETKLSGISLEARGRSLESGYLLLIYEFDGFSKFSDAEKKKKNAVF